MLLSGSIKKQKSKTQVQAKAQPQFVSGNEDDFYARFEDVTEIPEAAGSGWPSKASLDKALKQRRLWTMIEGDDGSLFFVPGFHYVNRLSHWTSKKPYPQGFDAEYRLDSAED